MIGDKTMHLENRIGTRNQARNYCRKEETRVHGPYEFGFWLPVDSKGLSADYLELREKLRKGLLTTFDDAEDAYPLCVLHYGKQVNRLLMKFMKKRNQKFRRVSVDILVGESGCGKTSSVYRKYGYDDVYKLIAPSNGKLNFIDGYAGEKVLLIDEFRDWIDYSFFLMVLDGHPLQFNCKGYYGIAGWTKVIITSNLVPGSWFDCKRITPALKRRYNTGTCKMWCTKKRKFRPYLFMVDKFDIMKEKLIRLKMMKDLEDIKVSEEFDLLEEDDIELSLSADAQGSGSQISVDSNLDFDIDHIFD